MAYGRKGPSCNSTRYETTVLEVFKETQDFPNTPQHLYSDDSRQRSGYIQFAIQTDHIALASFDICSILDEMI